jgi:hypothetical protein
MNPDSTKVSIRSNIILAANNYSKYLAGKVFLYVYGERYIEVMFPTDSFLHLTGVGSKLSASDFYAKAKDSKITTKQFCFPERHPLSIAKKKLPCLVRLPAITTEQVCILDDMKTASFVYRIAMTNLEFTLGLMEKNNIIGHKVFIPMTLRVKDKAIEKSNGGDFVDFVFVRDASDSVYSTTTFTDESKAIPDNVKKLLAM